MSNQTLWRTRMMFVSFNIAGKWVSYGNNGHFSKVCRGAVQLGIMNGMEYLTVPLLLNKIRAKSVLIRI